MRGLRAARPCPQEYRALERCRGRSRCRSPLFGARRADGAVGQRAAGPTRPRPARGRDRRGRERSTSAARAPPRRAARVASSPRRRGAGRRRRGCGRRRSRRRRPGAAAQPRLAVTSTHMVDHRAGARRARASWAGPGESASPRAQTYLNYLRTTPDRRIAFGWGGGRLAYGARIGGRVQDDPEVVERVRADLLAMFPALEGRRIEHAWGGPGRRLARPAAGLRDAARTAAPTTRYGFTGNGVGPSHLAGRVLASMALDSPRRADRRFRSSSPPRHRSRPSRLRYLGGRLVRAAMLRARTPRGRRRRAGPAGRRGRRPAARGSGFHVGR